MDDRLSRDNTRALFATAETLSEFELSAPGPLPDARTACHAADAWARVSGHRSVFVAVGLDETLDSLPALATPYGDEIELTAVCILGNDQALSDVFQSGQHLSHHILRLDAAGRKRADTETRKASVREFVQSRDRGVQLILLPWALSNREIRDLIENIVQSASPVQRAGTNVPENAITNSALPDSFLGAGISGVAALARSRRPIIMPGRRVLMQNDPIELANLARAMCAPVVLPTAATTAPPAAIERWRDAWPPDVPLVSAASIVWNYALIRADCILTLDARLTEGEMYGLRDFAFVRDDKVHALPIESVFGVDFKKSRDFLQMPGVTTSRIGRSRRRWCAQIEKKSVRLQSVTTAAAKKARTEKSPFDPAWISNAIFSAAPPETVFTGEGNGAGMWMWSYNHLRPTLYPDRMATIGLMLPWVLGAGRAAPERPIWCFAGDGSLGYQPDLFAELSKRSSNAVIFVFNNRAWSSIRLEQTFLFRGRYPGTSLPARNFAQLAKQHGCEGIRVETDQQFLQALERARKPSGRRKRPLVIDIPMPKDSIPFAGLSFALAEMDYLLRPMFAPFVASVLRALATGALTPRIPRMLLRMVLP